MLEGGGSERLRARHDDYTTIDVCVQCPVDFMQPSRETLATLGPDPPFGEDMFDNTYRSTSQLYLNRARDAYLERQSPRPRLTELTLRRHYRRGFIGQSHINTSHIRRARGGK